MNNNLLAMRLLLIGCLLFTASAYSQKSYHTKDETFWAALELVGYENIVSYKDGMKWYMGTPNQSNQKKFNDKLNISEVLLYMPKFTDINGKLYKDVAIFQDIVFNCADRTYKILKAVYYYDYDVEFDKVSNSSKKFNPVHDNTAFYHLLTYNCSN